MADAPTTGSGCRAGANEFKLLDIQGGAVVSGSFQLYDQGYLLDALSQLGNSTFVGVTQLPLDEPVEAESVAKLASAGVRAIRYNITRGVATGFSTELVRKQATAVHDHAKWHSEFYIDCALLADGQYFDLLTSLPVVSIDHVGFSAAGLPHLLRLLRHRASHSLPTYVKLTGFGRLNGSREDVRESIIALLRAHPESLVFGSDMPSTRAREPFSEEADVELILQCVQEVSGGGAAQMSLVGSVFWGNACRLYRLQ